MPNEEQVVEVLKTVFDPEIPVSIYDLGLIYKIDAGDDAVTIEMTLTSASCPSAQAIPDDIRGRITTELGVEQVDVNIVWDPPWGPEKISVEAKKKLGIEE